MLILHIALVSYYDAQRPHAATSSSIREVL